MQTREYSACFLIGLLALTGSAGRGHAQEQETDETDGGDLAQQARNPTAALTMLQIVVAQTPSFHNLEGADQTRIVVMPIIPFKTGDLQHIARITVPYVAAGPDWGLLAGAGGGNVTPPNYVPTKDKTGLSDTALFDFLIFDAPWQGGKLAAGLSAILPTATDPALGTEKWSAGPAVAGLVQRDKLLAGLIVLSNFSFAGKSDRDDVRTMAIQPFGSYGLASGWSVELSEMAASYNFESDKWGSRGRVSGRWSRSEISRCASTRTPSNAEHS